MLRFKLIGLLFFFLIVQVKGQNLLLYQPQSISFQSVSLDSALLLIEQKTDLHFTFRSDLLHADKKVQANFTDVPLCVILDSLFTNPHLNYQIIDKQLVVFEQKFIEKANEYRVTTDTLQPKSPKIFGGEIRDASTNEALPYAAIALQNSVLGTISNDDGIFSFTVPEYSFSDTLIISYLGYINSKIALKDIQGQYGIYTLQSTSIPLQEVIVRDFYPEKLVRLAISRITDNYSNHSFMQRAFYRESVRRDKTYMLYSEGILDVLKRPYRPTLFSEQVKLIKRRSFKAINQDDTLQLKLYGGIQTSLDLDVVKNRFPFMDTETLSDYVYEIRDMVMFDGKLTYVIAFKPENPKNQHAFEGCLYLDMESLAFVKIDFTYTKTALQKMKNSFIIRKSPRYKLFPFDAHYSITYKALDSTYYIYHIQGELGVKLKRKNKFLSSKYIADFEMVATELNGKAPRRFVSSETFNPQKIFSDISPGYDISFWGEDNFLLPEVDLMKAFESFNQEN